jgi:hypothetical protein
LAAGQDALNAQLIQDFQRTPPIPRQVKCSMEHDGPITCQSHDFVNSGNIDFSIRGQGSDSNSFSPSRQH